MRPKLESESLHAGPSIQRGSHGWHALQDGLCIPEQQQEGCGTHGKPLCPDHLVDQLGTLAILVSPTDGQPWKVMPTIYERNGCLWSCAPAPPCCVAFVSAL